MKSRGLDSRIQTAATAGRTSRRKSLENDQGPIMIILLSCLAVAMCFTTLGMGFVNLASGPRIPAPHPTPKIGPAVVPAKLEISRPEPIEKESEERLQAKALKLAKAEEERKKLLEEQNKKQYDVALAQVSRQSRDLDQEKRKLTQQQETLQKARATLTDLQKQLQDQLRQATERTRNMSRQAELDRAKAEADAQARLIESQKQLAALDKKAGELRQEIIDRKTLFDPQRIFGGAKTGGTPQWVECAKDLIVLIPQAERISLDKLKKGSSFDKAVTGKYVVFLVRPNGFETFNVARAAAEENGAEGLGYEPIDAAWQVKYK
ncbi:MAG: hypothetical protein M3Z23_14580 [Acidobacteriota bacterium]|nr:hypothetical protein [Acidobacteriota bacterium]